MQLIFTEQNLIILKLYVRAHYETLILYAPTPQNCQTHSKNSSADDCLSVFGHFAGLILKGLI